MKLVISHSDEENVSRYKDMYDSWSRMCRKICSQTELLLYIIWVLPSKQTIQLYYRCFGLYLPSRPGPHSYYTNTTQLLPTPYTPQLFKDLCQYWIPQNTIIESRTQPADITGPISLANWKVAIHKSKEVSCALMNYGMKWCKNTPIKGPVSIRMDCRLVRHGPWLYWSICIDKPGQIIPSIYRAIDFT